MKNLLTYSLYLRYINRATPMMVFYEDLDDEINRKFVLKMEEMCSVYKLVLCYKVSWKMSSKKQKFGFNRSSTDVICFRNKKVKYHTSDPSDFKLHNLFRTVYNDSVLNFLIGFNKILHFEGRIVPSHIHKLYEISEPSYYINCKDPSSITDSGIPKSQNRKLRKAARRRAYINYLNSYLRNSVVKSTANHIPKTISYEICNNNSNYKSLNQSSSLNTSFLNKTNSNFINDTLNSQQIKYTQTQNYEFSQPIYTSSNQVNFQNRSSHSGENSNYMPTISNISDHSDTFINRREIICETNKLPTHSHCKNTINNEDKASTVILSSQNQINHQIRSFELDTNNIDIQKTSNMIEKKSMPLILNKNNQSFSYSLNPIRKQPCLNDRKECLSNILAFRPQNDMKNRLVDAPLFKEEITSNHMKKSINSSVLPQNSVIKINQNFACIDKSFSDFRGEHQQYKDTVIMYKPGMKCPINYN